METAGSFNQFIFDAIQKYWDQDAMSDYGVSTLQYKDVARIIEKLHILFQHSGIRPGDKVALNKEITVSAVLLPAFQEMSEIELANAPQMRMSAEELNISLKGKSKAKETITIENVGKSLLDISSLQMFTTGLKVKLTKSRLDPGEKASLKVTVDARTLKAARSKPRLIMITNDPMKPKVIIHINVTE